MSFFAACASATSLLPQLEPIAGAALAINLAYVNLPRFRYRNRIRERARAKIEELRLGDQERLPDNYLVSEAYKQVRRLAFLPDYDYDQSEEERKTLKEELLIVDWPDGLWSKVYKRVFERNTDIVTSIILAALSCLYLLSGVLVSIGFLNPINCITNSNDIAYHFIILVVSMFFPAFAIYLGRHVINWSIDFIDKQITETNKFIDGMKEAARVADFKGDPPKASQR